MLFMPRNTSFNHEDWIRNSADEKHILHWGIHKMFRYKVIYWKPQKTEIKKASIKPAAGQWTENWTKAGSLWLAWQHAAKSSGEWPCWMFGQNFEMTSETLQTWKRFFLKKKKRERSRKLTVTSTLSFQTCKEWLHAVFMSAFSKDTLSSPSPNGRIVNVN